MSEHNVLFEGMISYRRMPVNYSSRDAALFASSLTCRLPDVRLELLPGITVLPPDCLFQGMRMLPHAFSQRGKAKMRNPLKAVRRYIKRSITRAKLEYAEAVAVPVYWITDGWTHNYFHWFCDAIPRLLAVWLHEKNIELLLPGSYSQIPFVQESLHPFRLKSIRYAPIKKLTYCDRLMLPTNTAINDRIVAEVRKLYRGHFAGDSTQAPRRVYISRALARTRRITNEAELLPILERHGFEVVHPETLTFSEQATLFAEARFIVAPHGAGLTNMLFMKSGGLVLELFNQCAPKINCYFELASACEQHYAYLQCEPADNTNRESGNSDILCPPSELDRLLEWLPAEVARSFTTP